MNDFQKICKNASRKLSAYTREQCINLGLMNGPRKQNSNFKKINNSYKKGNRLTPALSHFAEKRVNMIPNGSGGWKKTNSTIKHSPTKRQTRWVENGRGGWRKANANSSIKRSPVKTQTRWMENGHGRWKKANTVKQPMKCRCKANVENGNKYCMCNVPNMPHIHGKWVLTNFKM